MAKSRVGVNVAVASLVCLGGLLGWCSTSPSPWLTFEGRGLEQREVRLRHVPVHASEFSPLAEPLALPHCGASQPPEALATPDPLLENEDRDLKVRVSFIVGTDGRVYSPFILDSGSPVEDEVVLHVVRRWRYRPALCNGVPMDSEARVLFRNP